MLLHFCLHSISDCSLRPPDHRAAFSPLSHLYTPISTAWRKEAFETWVPSRHFLAESAAAVAVVLGRIPNPSSEFSKPSSGSKSSLPLELVWDKNLDASNWFGVGLVIPGSRGEGVGWKETVKGCGQFQQRGLVSAGDPQGARGTSSESASSCSLWFRGALGSLLSGRPACSLLSRVVLGTCPLQLWGASRWAMGGGGPHSLLLWWAFLDTLDTVFPPPHLPVSLATFSLKTHGLQSGCWWIRLPQKWPPGGGGKEQNFYLHLFSSQSKRDEVLWRHWPHGMHSVRFSSIWRFSIKNVREIFLSLRNAQQEYWNKLSLEPDSLISVLKSVKDFQNNIVSVITVPLKKKIAKVFLLFIT